MKIKGEYLLREVVGETILVPVGKTALEYNGMIIINETGALIWKALEQHLTEQEILEKMAEDKFTTKLKELSRPILSFNEEEPVSNILEQFLGKKEHIAVVIDDFGAARGIVTLEDVIETMLGFEIVDEKDEVVDMQELAKDRWRQVQEKVSKE